MKFDNYMGKFASSGDVQTAVDNGDLVKPYVALVGNSIDYNTLSVATGYVGMPLTFEITSDGDIVWKAKKALNLSYPKTIEYKKNDGAWTEITSSTGGTSISVVSGDTVQFRGDNATYTTNSNNVQYFNSFNDTTCGFIVYGNIMSLINSTNFTNLTTLTSDFTFYNLFQNCTGLTDASNLILPATTLTEFCYAGIFDSCTSLTATPELPATTLAICCYNGMFYGCASLTIAPVLSVSILLPRCYDSMFFNCSSLNYIKCLATDISAEFCIDNWVYGVPNSGGDGSSDSSSSSSSSSSSDEPVPFEGGTFVKHPDMNDWEFGVNGIPNGWTVEDAVL